MEEEFLCISNIEASHSNETDILPVPGCRSIPSIDVFSFTLPKEALDLEHDSSSWRTRGRGKSLADRALRSRELCRRPGNEMKNTVGFCVMLGGGSERMRACRKANLIGQ